MVRGSGDSFSYGPDVAWTQSRMPAQYTTDFGSFPATQRTTFSLSLNMVTSSALPHLAEELPRLVDVETSTRDT